MKITYQPKRYNLYARRFRSQLHTKVGRAVAGIGSLLLLASPIAALAKGGVDTSPSLPPLPAGYSIRVTNTSVAGKTVTVSGTASVSGFVGREDAQFVKFVWGDGQEEVTKAMAMPNYLKSSSNLYISSWTKVHTYAADGQKTITAKIYHGSTTGAEAYPNELKAVTVQTENTLASCTDRLDNDSDTFRDLNDGDCASFKTPETTLALCSDNFDNDNNGKTDLYDANCAPFVPKENTQLACGDGVDNDLDGRTDLADPDCASFIPTENDALVCADGIDNDLDGKKDLYDNDCAAFRPGENDADVCKDGIDNDYDGMIDGRDSDCVGQVPTEDAADVCLDGIDNDYDTLFDWNDPDCAAFAQPSNCPVGFIAFFIPGFGWICGANAGY